MVLLTHFCGEGANKHGCHRQHFYWILDQGRAKGGGIPFAAFIVKMSCFELQGVVQFPMLQEFERNFYLWLPSLEESDHHLQSISRMMLVQTESVTQPFYTALLRFDHKYTLYLLSLRWSVVALFIVITFLRMLVPITSAGLSGRILLWILAKIHPVPVFQQELLFRCRDNDMDHSLQSSEGTSRRESILHNVQEVSERDMGGGTLGRELRQAVGIRLRRMGVRFHSTSIEAPRESSVKNPAIWQFDRTFKQQQVHWSQSTTLAATPSCPPLIANRKKSGFSRIDSSFGEHADNDVNV